MEFEPSAGASFPQGPGIIPPGTKGAMGLVDGSPPVGSRGRASPWWEPGSKAPDVREI